MDIAQLNYTSRDVWLKPGIFDVEVRLLTIWGSSPSDHTTIRIALQKPTSAQERGAFQGWLTKRPRTCVTH